MKNCLISSLGGRNRANSLSLIDTILRQLAHPTGPAGVILGHWWRYVNEFLNEFTIEELAIQPTDHVLEIGFGPGAAIHEAARRASRGFVAGVDPSLEMVRMASKRNLRLVRAGRALLQQGRAERLPYPDERFDRVFTVNTVHFWPDPVVCLTEARRVLRDHGVIALGFPTREATQGLSFPWLCRYSAGEVESMLLASGFRDTRVVARTRGQRTRHCIIARRYGH
jgi:ubiquinone/menaquinone biosynthesis C-methylase UbiE